MVDDDEEIVDAVEPSARWTAARRGRAGDPGRRSFEPLTAAAGRCDFPDTRPGIRPRLGNFFCNRPIPLGMRGLHLNCHHRPVMIAPSWRRNRLSGRRLGAMAIVTGRGDHLVPAEQHSSYGVWRRLACRRIRIGWAAEGSQQHRDHRVSEVEGNGRSDMDIYSL